MSYQRNRQRAHETPSAAPRGCRPTLTLRVWFAKRPLGRCKQFGGVQRNRTGDKREREAAAGPTTTTLSNISSPNLQRIRRERSNLLPVDQGRVPHATRPRNATSCGHPKTRAKLDQISVPRGQTRKPFDCDRYIAHLKQRCPGIIPYLAIEN